MLFPSFIGLLAISWGFSSAEPQVEYSAEEQANFYVLAHFIIIDRLIEAYDSPHKALSNTILNDAVKEFKVELCDDVYYVWKRQTYTLLAVFDREQYQALEQQVDAVSKTSLSYVFSAIVGFEGFPVTEHLTVDYDTKIKTILEYIQVEQSPKFLLNLRGFLHLKNLPHTSLSKINVDKSPIKKYLLQPELSDVVDLLIQDSTVLKRANELYGPQDSVKYVNEAQYFIGDLSRLLYVHRGIECSLEKTKLRISHDCSLKLHIPAVSYDGLINSPWPACVTQ